MATAFFVYQKNNKVHETNIEIYDGASIKQIADLLENYGTIKNADIFYYYVKVKLLYNEKVKKEPINLIIKHGEYGITATDFDSLLTELSDGPDVEEPSFIITIPESSSLLDIAEILEKQKLFPSDDFIKYTQNKKVYEKYRKQYTWLPPFNGNKLFLLEGYLQANTYNLPDNPTVELITDMMLKETDGWYNRNISLIKNTKLTFDQVLTLASVVEAESKFKEDRPKVAQVFLNRIEKKMKLESDMTAAYSNGEHKVFMYYKDIETKSPYNTYHVNGLPLGPINSPSAESFVAILQPAGKDLKALYFYARPTGETFYANTWEEHETNRIKWEHEWKELLN